MYFYNQLDLKRNFSLIEKKMSRDPNFVFDYLKQVEVLASDVLIDRRDIIEYNKKKEQLREATRLV